MKRISRPVMLDDTGKEIVDQLKNIAAALGTGESKVYGFYCDHAESNPSSKISYVADAVGMTPVYMDYANDVFDEGTWGDVWFMRDTKPCILNSNGKVYSYLNKDDFTKDVDGNDVTSLVNGTTDNGQNVMIEFPKIWMKVVPNKKDFRAFWCYFAKTRLDDDFHDFPYVDKYGNHKEHFYMPAFNGSLVNGVMRSLLGKTVSNKLTAQQEIDACVANGDGWYTEDAGEVMLINFLLMLIGKSTDTQTVFGKGLCDGGTETTNDAFKTGVHNTKGMFYGTSSSEASTYTNAVKVFGIENWWGFQWRRYAGDINDRGTRKIKLCWGTEDGSTVNDFNLTGSGYVDVGATPSGTNGGYISEIKATPLGMFSKVSSGSSSTYFCDGQYFNDSQVNYAFRGGRSGHGLLVGAFCVNLNNEAGAAYWHIGAAPSCK